MDGGFRGHAGYEHHDLGSLQENRMAKGSNIGFLSSNPSIQISKPTELPTSTLSEQGFSWGSQSGASHYPSSEGASVALASLSHSFDVSGSIPVELSHLSVSASLSGSEGMQRRRPGDDRLFPHPSSPHDDHSDNTAYQPRVYFPGAPPRVVGFMDTSPITRPIDAISHFQTHDQSPGLQPRRPSVHGLGLLLPQHQEYNRSNVSSSQPLDMKPPTASHSPLPDQPIPNSSINDMHFMDQSGHWMHQEHGNRIGSELGMSEPVLGSSSGGFQTDPRISPTISSHSPRHRRLGALNRWSRDSPRSSPYPLSTNTQFSSYAVTSPPALAPTLSSPSHSRADSGFSAISDTPFSPFSPDIIASSSSFHSPHASTRPRSSRGRGQRVSRNDMLLEYSFQGQGRLESTRRDILDRIMTKDWYMNNDREPECGTSDDDVTLGLAGIGTRSVFTVFLDEYSKGRWKCAFGSAKHPCKRNMHKKTFDRVERAVDHVRSHLGHRPFVCNGECGAQGCEQRFFAAGYLEDHKIRRDKKSNCPYCKKQILAHNYDRHLKTHTEEQEQ